MKTLLEKYQYSALTIILTGDYKVIYQRFFDRENSPDRHRGHVVNDCYPERKENHQDAYKSGFDYDVLLLHHFGKGVDAELCHGFLGRFMKADAPVPQGYVSVDFIQPRSF